LEQALHYAAIGGHTEIVEALHQAGAKIFSAYLRDERTFADAARAGHVSVLRLMHKIDSRSSRQGLTEPLIVVAIREGFPDDSVKCLIELGIAEDYELGKPLDAAWASYGHDKQKTLKVLRRFFQTYAHLPTEKWIGAKLCRTGEAGWRWQRMMSSVNRDPIDFFDSALLETMLDCGLSPLYAFDRNHDLTTKALLAWIESGVVHVSKTV
jgi:hypothetical protein